MPETVPESQPREMLMPGIDAGQVRSEYTA